MEMDITVARAHPWASQYIDRNLDKHATPKQLVNFINRTANNNRTLTSFFKKQPEHLSLKAKRLVLETLHDMLFERKINDSFQSGSAKLATLIANKIGGITDKINRISLLPVNQDKKNSKVLEEMNGTNDPQTEFIINIHEGAFPYHILKLLNIKTFDPTLMELYKHCCEQKLDTGETLKYLCDNWTDSDHFSEISSFPDNHINVLTNGTEETMAKVWESIHFAKECNLNIIETREQIMQQLPDYDVAFNYGDPNNLPHHDFSHTGYGEINRKYCFFDITRKNQIINSDRLHDTETRSYDSADTSVDRPTASTSAASATGVNLPQSAPLPSQATLLGHLGPGSFYSGNDEVIKGNINVMLNGPQFSGSDMLGMLMMYERRPGGLDHKRVLPEKIEKEHIPQLAKLLREITDMFFSESITTREKETAFMVFCEFSQLRSDKATAGTFRYISDEMTRITGIPFNPDNAVRNTIPFHATCKRFFLALTEQMDKRNGFDYSAIPEEQLSPSSSAQWKKSTSVQTLPSGGIVELPGRGGATSDDISLRTGNPSGKVKKLKYQVEKFETDLDRLWEMHPQLAFEYRHSLNSALGEAKRRLKKVKSENNAFIKQVDIQGLIAFLHIKTIKLAKEIDAIETQKYASSVEKSDLAKMYSRRLHDEQAAKMALSDVITREANVLREMIGSA
jgi:hypothetical protein